MNRTVATPVPPDVVPRLGALAVGAAVLAATLTVLQGLGGLTAEGWLLASACALGAAVVLTRSGPGRLGPADLVTLTRLALGCALAGVAVAAVEGPGPRGLLPLLAAVTLGLDAVDGPVARVTATSSAFGRRFDGEVDAFVLLVLSGYVAVTLAWWVLTIGLMRYLFGVATLTAGRLRGELPPRYWRKVVAAAQGLALLVATAGAMPAAATQLVLAVAVALLAESFGRDVLWLWHRPAPRPVLLARRP